MFLAGFIFVTMFTWLTSIKAEMYVIGIWSLFVNAFIVSICSVLHNYFWTRVDIDENFKILVYISIAIVSSVIGARIYNGNFLKGIVSKIGKRTFGNNVFKDVIDFDKKTMMLIHLKDSEIFYGGMFRLMDEHGSNSYISLTNYCIYSEEDNQLIRDCSNQKMAIVFKLQDIQHIEILYENDSRVWEWLNPESTKNKKSLKT